MPGILIIGYGNLLRSDDAIGCRVAQELERHFHNDPEVEVIASPQLTPEMSDDVARSRFVLFLDACNEGTAGTVRALPVLPQRNPGGFTHTLSPSALLSAAEQLYGDAPEAMTLTLAAWSFDLGSALSPAAKKILPQIVQRARDLVEQHRLAMHHVNA